MTNDDSEKKPTDENTTAEPDAAPAASANIPQTATAPEPQPGPDAADAEPAVGVAAETVAAETPTEMAAASPKPETASEPVEQAQTAVDAAPETAPEPAADMAAPPPQPETETETETEVTPQAEAEPKAEPEPSADTEQEPALAAEAEPAAAAPEPKPLRIYEYRYIRVRQNAWDETEKAIFGQGAAAVAEAGGQLYGVWAGQIGLSANQGVVVTVWTDLDAAKRNGKTAIKGADAIAASETLYLEPTTRPADAIAPEGPGMFAHRVFEVRRDDIERFVELSSEAWPQFEDVFGAQVCALWRETGHDRAMDRLILLTRYPDYAAWEASRFWRPDPDPKAADALARFRERREITVDTVVYTTRLATAAAG